MEFVPVESPVLCMSWEPGLCWQRRLLGSWALLASILSRVLWAVEEAVAGNFQEVCMCCGLVVRQLDKCNCGLQGDQGVPTDVGRPLRGVAPLVCWAP
eukprot:3395586-Amphidinium_carterae.1